MRRLTKSDVRGLVALVCLFIGTGSALVFVARAMLAAFWSWRYDGAAASALVAASLYLVAFGTALEEAK